MSQIYVISDLHLGHKKILEFSGEFRSGTTVEEHDNWIIESWNRVVTKRDSVWVLGDVAFGKENLKKCEQLKGYKYLILGNHDNYPVEEYSKFFKVKSSVVKYRGFWLSHAPIHPQELRGLKNIHGHVHQHTIDDERYINVSVEAIGKPVLLSELEK